MYNIFLRYKVMYECRHSGCACSTKEIKVHQNVVYLIVICSWVPHPFLAIFRPDFSNNYSFYATYYSFSMRLNSRSYRWGKPRLD